MSLLRPSVPLPMHSRAVSEAEEPRSSVLLQDPVPPSHGCQRYKESFSLRNSCSAHSFFAEMSIHLLEMHAFSHMDVHTLLEDNKHCLLLLESEREAGKGVAALQSAK